MHIATPLMTTSALKTGESFKKECKLQLEGEFGERAETEVRRPRANSTGIGRHERLHFLVVAKMTGL